MSAEIIVAYTIALTFLAASPGPGVIAVIAQAITRGPISAFLMLTGLIIGDTMYLIAAAAGLGLLASKMGAFFIAVKYAGAAYLLWLAWKSWHNKKPTTSNKGQSHRHSLAGGIAISLSNPKVIVFYLAFLPTFLDLTAITAADIAILALITTFVSYIVLGIYIVGAAKLRQTISKPQPQKWFNRLSATMMASAGFVVAAR